MKINNQDLVIPIGYYSIGDPLHDTVTHWYCSERTPQWVRSWPTKAKPGPRLLARDVPKAQPERTRVLEAYWEQHRRYRAAVLQAIGSDPLAGAKFSAFSARCCYCGRVLTDAASKCYGIGPECRKDFSDQKLADFSAAMSAVLANHHEGISA